MIRFGMILAAMLAATPAMAQNWVEIREEDNTVVFTLDTDSVRKDGEWQRFQIRIPVGSTGTAYIDNVADCSGRFIEARHIRLVEPGKADIERDYTPGEQRHAINDAPGSKLLELVCR